MAFLIACGISLLLAFPVAWAWNYAVIPTFPHQCLGELTCGKAWCLSFLAHCFFKSINYSKSK